MLEINGNKYNLCLLDTNALSNLLKSPENWIKHIDNKFDISKTILCYSIFTLSELWYIPDLFKIYLDFFSTFPSAVLDGHESILVKEIQNYHDPKIINPIVLAPFSLNGTNMSPKERLKYVLKNSHFISRTKYWKDSQKEVLDGIISLKKNYPPEKKAYTKNEIESFCLITGMSQVGLRDRNFANIIVNQKKTINLDLFPSIKATSYVVFYKFYPDNRNPEPSDVFDILISSLLPYVDFFITEKNLNHIIHQIQKKHNFLLNVNCFTMKQIKGDGL